MVNLSRIINLYLQIGFVIQYIFLILFGPFLGQTWREMESHVAGYSDGKISGYESGQYYPLLLLNIEILPDAYAIPSIWVMQSGA